MEPPPKTDPLLLTPGPLTTSATVKQAMLHDYGSRDKRFIELNRRICNELLALCDAGHSHLCIPLQGSGSFAVEAMIANQLPGQGKLSAFGALPLSAAEIPFAALAASANKCLESVPGMGFVIAARESFPATEGNAHSTSLDLYRQWRSLDESGQWRFTPPVHCLLALDQALLELEEEGGVAGRRRRYEENCRVLVEGMRELDFPTLLPDELQAPIIVTFLLPGNDKFSFPDFYRRLNDRGYVIYPGKLTGTDSFRIGCIGHFGADRMRAAVAAVRQVLEEMGVQGRIKN